MTGNPAQRVPTVMRFAAFLSGQARDLKGAQRPIGVTSKEVDKQVFVNICPDFQTLSAAQIEDFLCVYAPYLLQDMDAIAKIQKRESNGCAGGGMSGGCRPLCL